MERFPVRRIVCEVLHNRGYLNRREAHFLYVIQLIPYPLPRPTAVFVQVAIGVGPIGDCESIGHDLVNGLGGPFFGGCSFREPGESKQSDAQV